MADKDQKRSLALYKIEQMIETADSYIRMTYGPSIREFFQIFLDDLNLLKQLYKVHKENVLNFVTSCRNVSITYLKETVNHKIIFDDQQFSLREDIFARLFSTSIEIMRDLLPLGTVVELDETFFKLNQRTNTSTKVVITKRFIAPKNYQSYFPYAGVIYPIGEVNPNSVLYFTEPLIQRIIHEGYKDEMENAYELLMKKEFIVDKDMNSIEFSTSDMHKLQKQLNEGKVGVK
jgi:hypothetical protein